MRPVNTIRTRALPAMCRAARARTGADATRHHGAGTDGQTDQHRGLEKANHAGESDCGGDLPLAKEGDVEQVQQIDGENRHQPDRAPPVSEKLSPG